MSKKELHSLIVDLVWIHRNSGSLNVKQGDICLKNCFTVDIDNNIKETYDTINYNKYKTFLDP